MQSVALLLFATLLVLLVNHFLVHSILGLAKPFWSLAKASGLLASLFTATSNLGARSSHLSLIVHPELKDSILALGQVACLALQV